jgi:ribosome maturation factor RimP
MTDVAAIADAVGPVVTALGLELYDVEVTGSGRARVVRVLVDREGGIDLDTIGTAAERISPVLDAEPIASVLRGPYALEVSSPGVERPLRRPDHFRRAVGTTVSVKVPGRRVRGVLVDAGDDSFELALEDGTEARIPYADASQARTVFEWGAEKGAAQRAARR